MSDLNGLLELLIKVFPIMVLGIYLGKNEARIEAIEKCEHCPHKEVK